MSSAILSQELDQQVLVEHRTGIGSLHAKGCAQLLLLLQQSGPAGAHRQSSWRKLPASYGGFRWRSWGAGVAQHELIDSCFVMHARVAGQFLVQPQRSIVFAKLQLSVLVLL